MNSLEGASSRTAGSRAALADYLEALARRIERGEQVTYESEVAAHADFAGALHELWPALQLLVSLGNSVATSNKELTPSAEIGPCLGEFRILSELGRGGMGVVYEAEQGQLGRRVALKVLPFAAVLDQRQLTRFQNEARAAASLHHTNIVPVFSVGCDRGRHFYAMQLIRGRSLEELLRERRERTSKTAPRGESPQQSQIETLNGLLDETLRPQQLFPRIARLGIQAAEALHCAHENGIVHRDVKPSNLLIDTTGKLWVADFGLARFGGDVGVTLTGDMLGTLRYMSPEQAAGMPAAVDHRADIYSLGATLYELATGRPVVAGQERAAILREIAEMDPAAPRKFTPSMPADLETILLKCLAKEPSARYDSAQALADDLRRFLEQKPVVARRPSRWDMLIKVARRHRALTAAMTLLLLSLVTGIVGTTWGMLRATEAERIAERERDLAIEKQELADEAAAISLAVNSFLHDDLLAQASPALNSRDKQVTVEELLDRAALRIEGKFLDQPRVEAAVRQSIGDAYFALGKFSAARPQMERAWEIRRVEFGDDHPETLDTVSRLTEVYRHQGELAKAESLAKQLWERCRRVLGDGHADTVIAMNNLAAVYNDQKRHDKAEALFSSALNATRRELGDEDPGTIVEMNNLAVLYTSQGKFAEAEKLLVQALDIMQRTLGEEHPDTLTMMSNLGALYKDQGRFDESERHFTRALEARRRVLGEESPDTITSLNNLATLYLARNEFDKAQPLFEQTLELVRRVEGNDHPHTRMTMDSLAVLYVSLGKLDEAESLRRESLEIARRVDGDGSVSVADRLSGMGEVQMDRHLYPEAESLLRESLASREQHQPGEWGTCYVKSLLGGALLGQQRYAEAEPLLLAGYQETKQLEATMPAENKDCLIMAAQRLVELYTVWNKPDEATKWRTELERIYPSPSTTSDSTPPGSALPE